MTQELSNSTRPLIAVVGTGRIGPEDAKYRLAVECGRLLVDSGYRIVTGGLGGVMEAACSGARGARGYVPGSIIGLLPGDDPAMANRFVDTIIPTGLDMVRNFIVAHATAVVAIGGGAGTLSELAMAWQLNRLVIGFRVEGWSGNLAGKALDERVRYPDIQDDRVYGVNKPREVIELLGTLLPRYSRPYTKISPQ